MMSLLSAHKLYRKGGGKSDFLQYLHDVAVSLLTNAPQLRNSQKRAPYDNLIRLTGRHFPDQIKYQGQAQKKKHGEKKCKVCYAKEFKNKKTTWQCPDCPGQPGFCQGDCFKIYHTHYTHYTQ